MCSVLLTLALQGVVWGCGQEAGRGDSQDIHFLRQLYVAISHDMFSLGQNGRQKPELLPSSAGTANKLGMME